MEVQKTTICTKSLVIVVTLEQQTICYDAVLTQQNIHKNVKAEDYLSVFVEALDSQLQRVTRSSNTQLT